jgi:hypothetical protein
MWWRENVRIISTGRYHQFPQGMEMLNKGWYVWCVCWLAVDELELGEMGVDEPL